MSKTAKKADSGKLQWFLLPWRVVGEVVEILMFGAEKYGRCNWQKSMPGGRNRFFAAAIRHLVAWYDGELLDPESGKSHLAHAMCSLLFLRWHEKHGSYDESEKS